VQSLVFLSNATSPIHVHCRHLHYLLLSGVEDDRKAAFAVTAPFPGKQAPEMYMTFCLFRCEAHTIPPNFDELQKVVIPYVKYCITLRMKRVTQQAAGSRLGGDCKEDADQVTSTSLRTLPRTQTLPPGGNSPKNLLLQKTRLLRWTTTAAGSCRGLSSRGA
jgi:hypothetical protein